MKTYEQLMTHYWGTIVPMAEAAGINPWECVRYRGHTMTNHPNLKCETDDYTFALTVLEVRPVFYADPIYSKCGDKFDWADSDYYRQLTMAGLVIPTVWTWTPPAKKRTFMLNGVELPCPVNTLVMKDGTTVYGLPINLPEDAFWFASREDRDLVNSTLLQLLVSARDKE